MRIGNVKNSDKYFHCKGNCEAAQRGSTGDATAENIGNAREWWIGIEMKKWLPAILITVAGFVAGS